MPYLLSVAQYAQFSFEASFSTYTHSVFYVVSQNVQQKPQNHKYLQKSTKINEYFHTHIRISKHTFLYKI